MLEEKEVKKTESSVDEENIRFLGRLRKMRIVKVWSARLFFTVLFVVAVIGMIIPLRPTYSDSEKRELASFPKFKMEALLSGKYFKDIDQWYSDSFPAREKLLKLNTSINGIFSDKEVKIHGEAENGDAIPSAEETENDNFDVDKILSVDQVSSEQETASQNLTSEQQTESKAETSSKQETASKTEVSSKTETSSKKTTSSKETTSSKKEASSKKETSSKKQSSSKKHNTQTLGALLIDGNTAYEYYNFNRSVADKYSAVVKKAAQLLKGKATVYDIVAPTSMGICLDEDIKKSVNSSNQNDAIKYIYARLGNDVKSVPLYDALIAKKDEYIYFRTDHHWTALGAYYSYCELMKAKNTAPLALADFKKHQFKGFLGSFYTSSGKLAQLKKKPDVVYAYEPKDTNTIKIKKSNGKWWTATIISDLSKTAASTKYLTFIKGDNGFSKITNNKAATNDSCILIKESFGNAFAPFLVSHYKNIYIVDYREYFDVEKRGLVKLQKDTGAKDVIFLNNISATRNKTLVNQIRDFVVK